MQLDAETRTHLPMLEQKLREAEAGEKDAPDEATRRTWRQAADHLRHARDRLRLGPFAPAVVRGDRDDDGTGEVAQ